MSRFMVEVVRDSDHALLRTDGYLNNLGAERIEQEYETLAGEGYRNFLINFERSPIINSMGLAILLGIIERNLERQGQIVFTNLTEVNAETMEIMDITQYVRLAATEEEGRKLLREGLKVES